jgi:hypothetical protein
VQQCLEQLRHVMHPHSRLVLNSYSFVWEAPLRAAAALGLKQKQPLQNWLSNADVAKLRAARGGRNVHRYGDGLD